MSATSEYESTARQDYGPTTSSENMYEHVLEHKLTDNMNVSSIRTPVLRPVPLSPLEGDPEPDSTNPESIIQSIHKVDKEVDFHINDKHCDTEMSVDSLSRIVRIEETTLDNVGRIAYPILQETDDSGDANYVENATTLIQAPLNTAIMQNVTKLPQNFTINVDAAVGNITAIQNVAQDASGSQTLWLPTILTTSAAPDIKNDDERPAGLSQIIITSESYVNDTNQAGRRTNIIETNYIGRPKASKVQILSNISLPKSPTFSQQFISQDKEFTTPVYGTQNHVYKLSANVVTQKHLNNSVLNIKPPKSQSLIGCSSLSPTIINNSPIKNVSYSHTYTKSTNLNKAINKVNNGANLNAMVAASTGNTQCHILSRVVSGPNKMSVHSGRKSVNTLKSSKSTNQGQKESRAIKIIQQAGASHKTEGKSWPLASVTYKNQQSFGVLETSPSKIIQKVGSPAPKSQPLSFQKVSKTDRLVLQSPCGPVLLSTAPLNINLPKGPHYVQSGSTPNLRYVQTYAPSDNQLSTASQVSANQQLTEQILQSLSQPKLVLHQSPAVNHTIIPPPVVEEPAEIKPLNQKRIVFGDKSTLTTADDIIGMEERPNLSEELRRYSYQALAFIMLDHTYSLPAQKQPTVSTPPPPVTTSAPAVVSPAPITTPMSPLKRNSPVIMSTAAFDVTPTTVPASVAVIQTPVTSAQAGVLTFKSTPSTTTQDDDAASVISSIDGDRAQGPQGGSDTETAPEGEEEGKTRCICDFTHDDGYMICCDRCGEWQHVDCMGIDRQNIPDAYMCEVCQPRPIDRRHARAIQLRKREELSALAGSDSDSSETPHLPGQRRKRLLTVTTYTNTSGSCVTTYNSNVPVLPPLPQPTLALPKRGPKRPKKAEMVRKGAKRKLAEKRVKRKKDMFNRAKYSSGLANQSHWQDSYEAAMTNHYSPELRAKIMKYSSKLGSSQSMASAITAHLCTTVPHAGGKILIATKDLKENTPVIELRGKYMLSNQHRPQLQNTARAGSQKPGPFVFFYRLPKDNTQICIDTRTYGNEARFVRRSCKPNAELQHCIIKGALHVYLVTIGVVQSNTEITVGHDTNGSKQPCACGNPKHCKVNGLNPIVTRKSIDYPQREKRSRNRCYSSSSPVSPPLLTMPTTPVKESPPPFMQVKTEKRSPIKHDFSPLSPIKTTLNLSFDEPIKSEPFDDIKSEIDLMAKEEMKPELDEPDYVNSDMKHDQIQPEDLIPDMKSDVEEVPLPPAPMLASPVFLPKVIQSPNLPKQVLSPPILPPPVLPPPVLTPPVLPPPVLPPVLPPPVLPPVLPPPPPPPPPPPQQQAPPPTPAPPTAAKEELMEIIKEEASVKVEKIVPKEVKEEIMEVKKPKEVPKVEDEKPVIKEEKKEVVAKSACHDRSARSSRTTCTNQDSLDDKTDDSQDKLPLSTTTQKDKKKMTREERKMEAIMKAFERMEKAEQRKQEVKERQKRRESDPHPNSMDRDEEEELHVNTKKRKRRKGRARTTSQSNRRRLNSADSDMVTSGDEAQPSPPHRPAAPPHTPHLPAEERPHELINEDIGLSSACLLVEAAVGSVESAFKLPKTKKTMATEWIGRSPERTPSPYHSPYRPALVSAPSLESLVRVASTMIGDLSGVQDLEHEEPPPPSPPRTPGRERNRPPKKAKRITRSTPTEPVEVVPAALPQHSAKKRWLRQAISEESDSPVIESPPNEMVTPLKKRRVARESLGCETNPITHCMEETSPYMASEDSPVKDDPQSITRTQYKRNIMESMYSRDRTRSDSGQGSDDQCNMDHDVLNVNIKVPHDTENIRRIIGVPTPEEEITPQFTKPEDINTNNNNNLELEESNYNKVVPMEIDTTIITQAKIQESNENSISDLKGIESPNDKVHSSQSADTSGNSSPQRDEMDDIQKKIHSFHTENILILKSRNKKPPKEKRKKVNLNFDLNMVDDQISIQLRTENDTSSRSCEVNGDLHDDHSNSIHDDVKIHVSPENIPLPPVETIPLPATDNILVPAPENIPLPEEPIPMPLAAPPETIPLPEEPMSVSIANVVNNARMSPVVSRTEEKEVVLPERPSVLDSSVPFSTRFSSTGLFSGIFSNMSNAFKLDGPINENIPNMSIIKSAIDRTTSLDNSLFDKDPITPVDELKSVQEILTRVNNMDSNNSVLLSGVLKRSGKSVASPVQTPAAPASAPAPAPAAKPHAGARNDPRLNPPPADKPKPVRRKLSITEYRKRHKCPAGSGGGGGGGSGSGSPGCGEAGEGGEAGEAGEWSSESSGGASLSPQRLEAAAAAAVDDLEQRLHRDLTTAHTPKGVFDAQPTASERQRENLSSRLRRVFGLTLPDDDDARDTHPAHVAHGAHAAHPSLPTHSTLAHAALPAHVTHATHDVGAGGAGGAGGATGARRGDR